MQYEHLNDPDINEPLGMTHLLREASLILKVSHPQWSGFMQLINQGEHAGETSVMFLRMIAMDPSDLSCIYSTLNFISSHVTKFYVCPFVAFDQPLWLKAFTLFESKPEPQPSVIRLGGFHSMMSYLGSMGHEWNWASRTFGSSVCIKHSGSHVVWASSESSSEGTSFGGYSP